MLLVIAETGIMYGTCMVKGKGIMEQANKYVRLIKQLQ